MKVIYIAGRYRDARGEYYVRQNIRRAEEAALDIWSIGGVALCPHKNTAGFGGALGIPDDVWLVGDLELLKRCDAVYVVPGWNLSNDNISLGTKAEIEFAESLGIPVFQCKEYVYEFISGKKWSVETK